MKKEGYAGAGAMREFVEYLWGWNATVPETVDAAMWKETFDVYVEDKHHPRHEGFLRTAVSLRLSGHGGPHGRNGPERLLGRESATKKKLLAEYIDSVNQHGASGAEVTTGNARLSKYVIDQAKAWDPVSAIEGFQRAMERAMGSDGRRHRPSHGTFRAQQRSLHRCARGPTIRKSRRRRTKRRCPGALPLLPSCKAI